jgi:hypothetical protein
MRTKEEKEKRKITDKKYRIANKEKVSARQKRYCDSHKKEIAERGKKYHASHEKEIKKYNQKYNAAHKKEIRKHIITHKEERKATVKKYNNKNRENYRKHRLKTKYNITIEQYNFMLEKQNGCCNICKKHQDELKNILAVDHDHATGKIRGLLCMKCNRALGAYNDNIDILLNAIEHLKNNPLNM